MRFLILTLLFFGPTIVLADRPQIVIAPFGVERRVEGATNPTMVAREPVNVAAGVRLGRQLITLEYTSFRDSSGNEAFRIERQMQDLTAWLRHALFDKNSVKLYGGAGLGLYQETLTTQFYELKDETSTGALWTAAVAGGVEYIPVRYLSLMLEGRLIMGHNLEPNPNPGVLARVAVQF